VPTAEERTAPCDALGLEANSLIGATSAGIFREHTEPNSMCISILENDLNELHEQRLAVAAAWMGNAPRPPSSEARLITSTTRRTL
jgi:hypothetical protein